MAKRGRSANRGRGSWSTAMTSIERLALQASSRIQLLPSSSPSGESPTGGDLEALLSATERNATWSTAQRRSKQPMPLRSLAISCDRLSAIRGNANRHHQLEPQASDCSFVAYRQLDE